MTFSRSHTRQMPRNCVLGRLKAGEMNKTESAYAEHLKASQIAGEVALWWFECVGLKVAAKCHYYPDFMVMFPDGRIEIHEVKARNSAGGYRAEGHQRSHRLPESQVGNDGRRRGRSMTTKAEMEQMITRLPKQHTKPGRVLPVRKRRIGHPEADEQAKVIAWAHHAYRTRSDLYPLLRRLHCSLNGVKLSKTQAGIAKGQGMLRGVPDLFLPVPRGNYAGLYIEMKHGDNKPTPEQARFLQESVDCGYQAAVCWSAAEAIAVIQVYYGVSE